jgi:hypothetical protein
MGADFTFTSIPYAELTPDRVDELNAVVDALNETEDDSDVGWLREIIFGDERSLDDIKKRLRQAIAVVSDDRIVYHRETGIGRWVPMDYDVILTGGLSWGDDPTEIFYDINLLANCPQIEQKLLEWAREDFAKKQGLVT